MKGRAFLSLAVLLIASGAAAGEPRFEAPAPGSYELPPIDQVRDHSLVGPDGLEAPLLGLAENEAAVVSFVYLSCADACPLATSTLMRLDRELAKDPELAKRARMVTASFDPARDTPASMLALREHLKPQSRWQFRTARDWQSIQPVLADFGQDRVPIPNASDAPASDLLRHVLKVFLVDSKGQVRNIYSSAFLDVRLLIADLRTVLELP